MHTTSSSVCCFHQRYKWVSMSLEIAISSSLSRSSLIINWQPSRWPSSRKPLASSTKTTMVKLSFSVSFIRRILHFLNLALIDVDNLYRFRFALFWYAVFDFFFFSECCFVWSICSLGSGFLFCFIHFGLWIFIRSVEASMCLRDQMRQSSQWSKMYCSLDCGFHRLHHYQRAGNCYAFSRTKHNRGRATRRVINESTQMETAPST